MAPFAGKVHDIVHLDGIRLRRKAVAFVAATDGYTVGRHLVRAESASAWAEPMPKIPPPGMAAESFPGFSRRESRPAVNAAESMNARQNTSIDGICKKSRRGDSFEFRWRDVRDSNSRPPT